MQRVPQVKGRRTGRLFESIADALRARARLLPDAGLPPPDTRATLRRVTAGLDDLLARLRAVLLSGPPLRLAMLFGSMARGDAGPASDVDIAVLPTDPDLALGAELDLGAALERACGRPVDLVRLDQASTLLRWRIAREGVVLFAEPLVERVRFLASAASEHGDFAPAYSAASELFRRRLAARAGAKEGS